MNFSEFAKDMSIVIASCTAIYGIGSWRREYRGKKRAELAEEALCLFYEAGDAVQHIRSPFASQHEGSTRKVDENETPDQKKAFDRAYVLIERFNTHIDLFNKMRAMRYRFIAQFGSSAGEPFEAFRKILIEMTVSAQTLGSIWAEQFRVYRMDRSASQDQEFIKKLENIFWEGLSEEDPIKPRVEECIRNIEGICRPIIDNKSQLSLGILRSIKALYRRIANNRSNPTS